MKYTCENGRSMVEMLGVLMLMVVLSLVGLVGYNGAKGYWKVTNILGKAQEFSSIARVKARNITTEDVSFTLPKGVHRMDAIIGGQEITINTTEHGHLTNITREPIDVDCGTQTIPVGYDKVRVWYDEVLLTQDDLKLFQSYYKGRCLGPFVYINEGQKTFPFFYISFPDRNVAD